VTREDGYPCPGPAGPSRRAFLGMLALGAALTACGGAARPGDAAAPALPPVPAAHPGSAKVVFSGPAGGGHIALTVDDGTCADCVTGYVEFARRTNTHLTFSPNGTYAREWEPHAGVLAPLVAAGQVQIMNHTFTHPRLTTLPDAHVRAELERNEQWVQRVFGITTRPYYRPPFGFHDPRVDGLAAELGWTRCVLWNGSYSDSETVTPEFFLQQARRYLKAGTIMLGHANHPTVLGMFDQITALLADRNLHPVTLDEMFGTSRAIGTA
jgi:peptidoglycan-N-acetylglucosamine deacetylase